MEARDRWLNSFAISSFRDTADFDYITARMAYRSRLIQPFLWSSLQVLEKYLKCILVLNRVNAKKLGHDIGQALKRVNDELPFQLNLRDQTLEFIKHIDTYGRFRYLETPFYVLPYEIFRLDWAVWDIRRYCQVLNYDIEITGQPTRNMLAFELERIEVASLAAPQKFKISGGALERIIETRNHPARSALLWQSATFGGRTRSKIRLQSFEQAVNSPLSLHPEMLDYALKFVQLQDDVKTSYREQAQAEAEAKASL